MRPELFGQRGGGKGDTEYRTLRLSRVLVLLAGDTGGVESELLGQVGWLWLEKVGRVFAWF